MVIDLTKPQELPEEFVTRLKAVDRLCRKHEFSEDLIEQNDIYNLVQEINNFCTTRNIVGIHYTRALPEHILKKGLLIRNGNEIRENFLNEYTHLFTESEIITIKKRWDNYFNDSQSSARDGRIFFNFTEAALSNGGAKKLLSLYGGEQINMCFDNQEPIGKKLASIGVPLVVKCALNPNLVKTFIEYPWGKILVSAYHLQVNPEAFGIDQDGYQSIPVEHNDILTLKEHSN